MVAKAHPSNPAPLPPPDPDRDAVTAQLLAALDQEGLNRLLADHGGRIRWVLRREFSSVLDDSEIDEAINQAAHKAWRNARRYDAGRGSLRSWFYVIARTSTLRLLEQKKRRANLSYLPDLDASQARATAPEPVPADQQQFVDVLYRCIDELSPQQRAVVLADLAAGGTAPATELAAELKTTPNSVYVSRNAARRQLRIALARNGHIFPATMAAPAAGSEPAASNREATA